MTNSSPFPYHRALIFIVFVLTILRVTTLYFSPLNLHGDEAQYWAWSRSFEFGYFSKPPLIAWTIAATTAIFGNEEWAVRISSPLIHMVTAYVLFRTGQFLWSARAGFWAACFYFLMPAVWLSSGIVSTDVGLLLWWVVALNAWAHLRQTMASQSHHNAKKFGFQTPLLWAILLGVSIGLGLLSKYAMLFFILSILASCMVDAPTRRAVLSRYGAVVLMLAALIISPNLVWNLNHDFATLNHTAANANLGGSLFHPRELLSFLGSQFVVFGPVSVIILGIAIWKCTGHKSQRSKQAKKSKDHLLWCLTIFTLCPLAIISAEAFLSRANANWAVSAYGAGSLVVGYFVASVPPGAAKLPRLALFVNSVLGLTIIVLALSPKLANQLGAANGVKRVRGWPQTVTAVHNLARAGHQGLAFQALATDNRLVFFDLQYYQVEQKTGLDLRMWKANIHPAHHAELTSPLLASTPQDGPVLLINYFTDCHFDRPEDKPACLAYWHDRDQMTTFEKLQQDFERLEPLPNILIALGGGKTRSLRAFAAYGYTPSQSKDR